MLIQRELEGAGRIYALHGYPKESKGQEKSKTASLVRQIAHTLVDQSYQEMIFHEVADAMVDVLDKVFIPPVNLVPMPDAAGRTERNLALCVLIRERTDGIHVQDILEGEPRPSMYKCHKFENRPPPPESLRIRVKKNKRGQRLKNAVLVDNVLTSGTTYLACRDAILRTCEVVSVENDVDILVWADASETIPQAYRRV